MSRSISESLKTCASDVTLNLRSKIGCRYATRGSSRVFSFGLQNRPEWVSWKPITRRSEEHTSELQSRFDLVCRLLLEKKNSLPQHPQRIQPRHFLQVNLGPATS